MEVLKDLGIRAVKTGVQTFGALVTVDTLFAQDYGTIESAGIAALAAALSVIWNAVLAWAATR